MAESFSGHPTFAIESFETFHRHMNNLTVVKIFFPVNFSDDHLNSSRRPHHQVHRPLIYPLEGTLAPASPPHAFSFSSGNHHGSVRGWRMGGSSATRFHLRCRPFNYPTLTFEPCNSVFQTLFCPTTFFLGFCACLP